MCYLSRNSDKKDEKFEKDSSKNYDDREIALDKIRIDNIDMEIETIVDDPQTEKDDITET